MPPSEPPSVERKTMRCVGLTRRVDDGVPDAPTGFAYERASSISAAVPEALSFAPGLAPELSRCARTTIVEVLRPGAVAITLANGSVPRPATVSSQRSTRGLKPYGWSWSTTQRAAPVEPAEPDDRSG
jgi:hypothetical protein